ncbi:hypothetical protein KIN20_031371 [Parelaphostrongylus tenuis]|uniref:Uncharacterized protein n=1 Tax=Parelaphostrongylus tenuis TaxID=148309 RepID=A0AAD5WHJ9_PARTN|nr:hypothetical protein KIN20_031371 [Parelaphostrongylus tenuis]
MADASKEIAVSSLEKDAANILDAKDAHNLQAEFEDSENTDDYDYQEENAPTEESETNSGGGKNEKIAKKSKINGRENEESEDRHIENIEDNTIKQSKDKESWRADTEQSQETTVLRRKPAKTEVKKVTKENKKKRRE